MPLVFCDESDTVAVVVRNVFVYACLRMDYATYEALERAFLVLKRDTGIAEGREVKWAADRTFRTPFLRLIAEYPVGLFYYVVADKAGFSRAERYRRKVLQAAFRSLCGAGEPVPLLVLDARSRKQDREEAQVLEYLRKAEGLPVPAYAFLPSDRVIGLQLADLVAGALRTYEAEGEQEAYSVIQKLVRSRVVVSPP